MTTKLAKISDEDLVAIKTSVFIPNTTESIQNTGKVVTIHSGVYIAAGIVEPHNVGIRGAGSIGQILFLVRRLKPIWRRSLWIVMKYNEKQFIAVQNDFELLLAYKHRLISHKTLFH